MTRSHLRLRTDAEQMHPSSAWARSSPSNARSRLWTAKPARSRGRSTVGMDVLKQKGTHVPMLARPDRPSPLDGRCAVASHARSTAARHRPARFPWSCPRPHQPAHRQAPTALVPPPGPRWPSIAAHIANPGQAILAAIDGQPRILRKRMNLRPRHPRRIRDDRGTLPRHPARRVPNQCGSSRPHRHPRHCAGCNAWRPGSHRRTPVVAPNRPQRAIRSGRPAVQLQHIPGRKIRQQLPAHLPWACVQSRGASRRSS